MAPLSSKKFIILNAAAIRQLPIRVNIRGRDHRSQRSEVGENQSPGPDESSPVRSAGYAYFKRRPSRRDYRWLLVLLKSSRDQEPNVSIVPCPESFRGLRDGHLYFASFPSTSYWATFTKSLRDESSAHTPKPYVDAHGRRLPPDEVGKRVPNDFQE